LLIYLHPHPVSQRARSGYSFYPSYTPFCILLKVSLLLLLLFFSRFYTEEAFREIGKKYAKTKVTTNVIGTTTRNGGSSDSGVKNIKISKRSTNNNRNNKEQGSNINIARRKCGNRYSERRSTI
jgi:hypothetical protein